MVGLSRFELLTPRLSSVCSNQLSYRPSSPLFPPGPERPTSEISFKEQMLSVARHFSSVLSKLDRRAISVRCRRKSLRPRPAEYQIDLELPLANQERL